MIGRSVVVLGMACGALLVMPLTAWSIPVLEEVIVTAEKRAESIQDVPISIAAFDENTLEKMGVYDIKGLASKVPNVVVNEFTGASTTVRLFIRGVGCVGYPGSAEVVNMQPPDALIKAGINHLPTVGDGRQSGTSESPSILNASPEALAGGGLACRRVSTTGGTQAHHPRPQRARSAPLPERFAARPRACSWQAHAARAGGRAPAQARLAGGALRAGAIWFSLFQ